jgi:putative nucleotidyltransferase with HDIG domain
LLAFENRVLHRDGSERWLSWRAQSDGGVIYATARDITSQKDAEEMLRGRGEVLERMVRERTVELEDARVEMLRRLALAAEYRDDDTFQHTERVGRIAALLAERLGLEPDLVERLRLAAPLHDIGKLAVSDAILLKPGRLTADERWMMQTHAAAGAAILADSRSPVLQLAEEIALTHHERWDGLGYPRKLVGDEIPLPGRITAIADVFDALTHARPYKPAWSIDEAVREILARTGTQFDPTVVDAFAKLDHAALLQPIHEHGLRFVRPAAAAGRQAGQETTRTAHGVRQDA